MTSIRVSYYEGTKSFLSRLDPRTKQSLYSLGFCHDHGFYRSGISGIYHGHPSPCNCGRKIRSKTCGKVW